MGIYNPASPAVIAPGKFVTPELYQQATGRLFPHRGETVFFACRSGESLAKGILASYNALLEAEGSNARISLDALTIKEYNGKEIIPRSGAHLEGKDVYVFQSCFDPLHNRSINDNLMELCNVADNARFHGADKITAIVPYFPYLRQDKPSSYKREPITAKFAIQMLELAGVSEIFMYDPHFPQVIGYANKARIHTMSSIDLFKKAYATILTKEKETHGLFWKDELLTLVSPDTGYAKNLELFAKAVGSKFCMGYKTRNDEGVTKVDEITGKLKYVSHAIIKDDIFATGGTIKEVVQKLQSYGVKKMTIFATHFVPEERTYAIMQELATSFPVEGFYFLNTIPFAPTMLPEPVASKVHVLSIYEELALALNAVMYNRSVSERFTKVEK
ncbi:MAG: ribose-phosphate diphosphokinase [Candidatus Woesearchaeota archaeon]